MVEMAGMTTSGPAGDLETDLRVESGAVLPPEPDRRLLRLQAEAFAVLEQAPVAAEQVESEAADGHVGDAFEGRAEASVDAVNPTDELEIDLTREVDGEIG
jgi:hypothetical protein